MGMTMTQKILAHAAGLDKACNIYAVVLSCNTSFGEYLQ